MTAEEGGDENLEKRQIAERDRLVTQIADLPEAERERVFAAVSRLSEAQQTVEEPKEHTGGASHSAFAGSIPVQPGSPLSRSR